MNTETIDTDSRPASSSLPDLEPITLPIKYVFLDVVGFTRNRTTEAQVEILQRLNATVRSVVEAQRLSSDKIIFLPTGDGMCIALLDISAPFDIHVQLGVKLIQLLQKENSEIKDEMRRFSVRIGLNECDDTLVRDINNGRNVAGLGVNVASRVMELADASQIMVSGVVHERLRGREKYMSKFQEFWVEVKHGEPLNCFQYIDSGIQGLNCEVPKVFQKEEIKPVAIVRLDSQIAAYIALCIEHKSAITELLQDPVWKKRYIVKILLWFMAQDHVATMKCPTYKKPVLKVQGAAKPFIDRFRLYEAEDLWITQDFQSMISESYLRPMAECFESDSDYLIPSRHGWEKLEADQPQIAEEFGLLKKKTSPFTSDPAKPVRLRAR